MKLVLNFTFFLFTVLILGDKSYSISNYQIKQLCKKEKDELTCIKILQNKKSTLQKGDLIEIPVLPYKN